MDGCLWWSISLQLESRLIFIFLTSYCRLLWVILMCSISCQDSPYIAVSIFLSVSLSPLSLSSQQAAGTFFSRPGTEANIQVT